MKKYQKLSVTAVLVASTVLIMVTGCKKDNDADIINDIDGNAYHTVTIGSQIWLRENLMTTKLNDGTLITTETGNNEWASLNLSLTPGYCWYGNNQANKSTYGALYNYAAVTTNKLCPAGWHVPSEVEWKNLRDLAGGEPNAGGKLKEKGTVHWNSPNTGATDDFGFTALPSGERYEDGGYVYLGINNNFWSTTIGPGTDPYGVRLYHDGQEFHMSEFHKGRGLSVRCIKN